MKSLYIVAAVILLGAFAAALDGPVTGSRARLRGLAEHDAHARLRHRRADDAGLRDLQGVAAARQRRHALRHRRRTRDARRNDPVPAWPSDASLVVMQLKDTSDLSRLVVHTANLAQ